MRISDWSSDVCSSDLADLSGYGNVTYGQDNQLTLEGAISGPLSDRVRVRVAGKWDRHDGHYKNLFVNAGQDSVLIGSGGGRIDKQLDDREVWGVRGTADVELTEDTLLSVIGSSSDNKSHSIQAVLDGTLQPATTAPDPYKHAHTDSQ